MAEPHPPRGGVTQAELNVAPGGNSTWDLNLRPEEQVGSVEIVDGKGEGIDPTPGSTGIPADLTLHISVDWCLLHTSAEQKSPRVAEPHPPRGGVNLGRSAAAHLVNGHHVTTGNYRHLVGYHRRSVSAGQPTA